MVDVCVLGYVTREWEVLPDGTTREIIAGAAYFVAVALASLGDRVRVITKVDPEDRDLVKELMDLGIEVVNTGSRTMKSRLVYRSMSERDIEIVSPPEKFTVGDVELCRDARAIYIGPQTLDNFDIEVLARASRYGMVFLDVQGFTRCQYRNRVEYVDWFEKNLAAYHVDTLKVDHREGMLLTKTYIPSSIALKLMDIGYRTVVLTTDSGVYIGSRSRGVLYAPYVIDKVIGRTGRGDTALASYIHAYLRGWPLEIAVRFVAAATSIKLSSVGPLKVDEKTVLNYVHEHYL